MRLRSLPAFDDVVWEPQARGLVRDDANYCFVRRMVSREEFLARFPNKDPTKESIQDDHEYLYRSTDADSGGTAAGVDPADSTTVDAAAPHYFYGFEMDGDESVVYYECYDRRQRRTSVKGKDGYLQQKVEYEVHVTNFGARGVLNRYRWPGTVIPVFTFIGSQYALPGYLVRNGLITDLSDTQRMLNLLQSFMLEQIAAANKANWLVESDSIAGFEEWERLGEHTGYLRWKQGEGDKPAVPPQRVNAPGIGEGMASMAQLLVRNADMITGVSEAFKGQKSNETSRAAIVARTQNSALAVDHFPEHVAATLRRCGEAMGELIPKIYTSNNPVIETVVESHGAAPTHRGVMDLSELAQIPLQVELSVNYISRKDQQLQMMQALIHNAPDLAAVLLPFIIKQLDLDDKEAILHTIGAQMEQAAQPDPLQQAKEFQNMDESASRAEQNRANAQAAASRTDKEAREQILNEVAQGVEMGRTGYESGGA